jgi:hypothetical protein
MKDLVVMVLLAALIVLSLLCAEAIRQHAIESYRKERRGLEVGSRVITPEGKVGSIVTGEECGFAFVRVLLVGANGVEQYQEVRFRWSELRLVVEKGEEAPR